MFTAVQVLDNFLTVILIEKHHSRKAHSKQSTHFSNAGFSYSTHKNVNYCKTKLAYRCKSNCTRQVYSTQPEHSSSYCLKYLPLSKILQMKIIYFDVCTVHYVQFIIQTNKCTLYIYIYIYIYSSF
jgi:hypothetical protein